MARRTAVIQCFALTVTIMLSLLIKPAFSIYCDEDDCYDLLGVTQNANSSEIKKAYYKLSLKHHPDKNPDDPEAKKLFVKIANAYEILKDEATREQYDYALAHPEEIPPKSISFGGSDTHPVTLLEDPSKIDFKYLLVQFMFYNTARYYHAYYGHKTDPRAVLIGLLLILSSFQYLNQWTRYNQAIDMVKKTPAYKNKLRAVELQRTGGVSNRKKGNKPMNKEVEEELSKELNLQIKGAEKPSVWGLIGIRFILLPYTLGKLLLWYGCWFWRYNVKHAPYSWEDASYLTRRSLGAPLDSWISVDESTKEDLIHRRLWEKSNFESYVAEMRKESKRRRRCNHFSEHLGRVLTGET